MTQYVGFKRGSFSKRQYRELKIILCERFSSRWDTQLLLDATHVDIWVKLTAFIIYLQGLWEPRSMPLLPKSKHGAFTTYGKHFLLCMCTFAAFDCCAISVGDFKVLPSKMETCGFGHAWHRAAERMNQGMKMLRNVRQSEGLLLVSRSKAQRGQHSTKHHRWEKYEHVREKIQQ